MYYRPKNELIITSPRQEEGSSVSKFVHANHKRNMWGKLNYLIDFEVKKNDLVLHWRDQYSHSVDKIFGLCPLILNYFSLRGFENILFVGHYDRATRYWTLPRKESSLFPTPSIDSESLSHADLNIAIQFIPIVKMAYGYNNLNIHTLVPEESKYRAIVHSLYRRYEIDAIPCDKQYMYGRNITIKPLPDTKYDAVVFGACTNDFVTEDFSISDVKSDFADLTHEGSKFIELKYSDRNTQRFIGGSIEPNDDWLTQVFANHSLWDRGFVSLSDRDKKIFYEEVNNIITCYT